MQKLVKWHRTKPGLLVFAVVELALAYAFISLSIDHGNLWFYLLTLIFLVGFLQNIFKLIASLGSGNEKTRR